MKCSMNKILTIDELSEKLKIPKKTLYKWRREKRIPCVKLGKHLIFIESDIDQWLKESYYNGKRF